MCQLFAHQPQRDYESQTRSLRIDGHSTSIRLEMAFWDTLEEIGTRDGMNVPQLLCKLYDELLEHRGDIPNFASFLRVSSLRYLALQVEQRIPSDVSIPISSLDAHAVLRGLRHSLVEVH